MTQVITHNGIQYKVETFVAVFSEFDDTILDECMDMREAKKKFKGYRCIYKWAAAEWINDDGDLAASVYGETKQGAIKNLRAAL